jgi:glutathione S-transferase
MTRPTLYHCRDARSFRCLWAAEEVGFDLDLITLPFPPRVFAPEFKAINPLGTIPAWVEGGHVLTESAAICQRVALGTALEVMPDEADWMPYLNWLHRSDATLTFPQTLVLRYTRLEPKERRLPQAVEDYKGFFLGRAKSIESALADGRDVLVARRFTLADVTVGYALFLARSLGLDTELGPLSQAWLAKLMARPAFIAAQERQASDTA